MFNLPTIDSTHSVIRVDGSLFWDVLFHFGPDAYPWIATVEDLPAGQFSASVS